MDEIPLPAENGGGVAEIDLCSACGGAWFEFFDGMPTELSRRLLVLRPTLVAMERPARSGQGLCPGCQRPMLYRADDYAQGAPYLLRCDSCFSCFVSNAQLLSLAASIDPSMLDLHPAALSDDPDLLEGKPWWTYRILEFLYDMVK